MKVLSPMMRRDSPIISTVRRRCGERRTLSAKHIVASTANGMISQPARSETRSTKSAPRFRDSFFSIWSAESGMFAARLGFTTRKLVLEQLRRAG